MLIKREKDMEQLREWAEETEGECGIPGGYIKYRLSVPVYLAFAGRTEELREGIHRGLPVLGLDIDICRLLEKPMYMEKIKTPENLPSDPLKADECLGITSFYTTTEAAVMGGQYETLMMLLEEGAPFNLKCSRLRDIFLQCEDERIIEYVLGNKETYWSVLFYGDILERRNLALIKALYEHGCRPEEEVLDSLYIQRYWGGNLNDGWGFFLPSRNESIAREKMDWDEAVRFFSDRGYELHENEMNSLLGDGIDFQF